METLKQGEGKPALEQGHRYKIRKRSLYSGPGRSRPFAALRVTGNQLPWAHSLSF